MTRRTTPTLTPRQFFDALFGHAEDGWLTMFTIDASTGDRRTDWFGVDQLDRLVDLAIDVSLERNVWFGVATRKEKLPDGRRGGAVDCGHVGALWVDMDVAGPNHANASGLLPDDDTARALLRTFKLYPSIVVKTGGGYHGYWLLDEMLSAEDVAPLLERWAATWAEHAAESGTAVDNVFDLPRVLRVPGTINHKNGAEQIVEVLWADTSNRYSVSDIIDNTIEARKDPTRTTRALPYTGLERPGDDFNARHTGGDVLALDGWTLGRAKPNGEERWLHPWSPTSDESATVYPDNHTTIWSDTVPKHRPHIEIRQAYDPFGLYARLFHDGNFSEASIELAKKGYGTPSMAALMGISDIISTSDTPLSDDDIAAIEEARQRRQLFVGGARHLHDIANDIADILVELNDPPNLFRHGDVVSQFCRGELEAVDRVRMVDVVESCTRPVVLRKDDVKPARVEVSALDLALLRLIDRLPVVNAVVRSPFLREDGTVCADTGYDHRSGNYLAATTHVRVPDEPTTDEVDRAVALIDDMIADFPLATPADRAHVYALLLTPLVRHLVPLTPLFILDGNGPGVGKNLLAESCMYIATGEWVQTDPLPTDAEEQRKQITALMSTGRSVALFDEAHIITGTSLARLITSTTWGDRLLGYSKQVSYPNRITVCALGNNVEVQGDMPRRSILIRLESPLARPYDRQDFRHDNLREWVEGKRHELVGALLTILVAWHRAGRPRGGARLGSFDAWAAIVGGALDVAGIDGFMSNVGEMRQRGASDEQDIAAHLWELNHYFIGQSFTAKQVGRLLENDALETFPPRMGRDKNYAQSLGHVYRHYSDRWFDRIRIVSTGVTHGARRWAIETQPVDNSPETGGKGGLGGLSLPTHEENSGVEGDGDNNGNGGEKVPPVPPVPPDPDFDPF